MFRIVAVMDYQPTPSSHKFQNYLPQMERPVRHRVKCNRTIHLQTLLLLVVVARLQSPTYQVFPDVLHRLEQRDRHSMNCNRKVQFQAIRLLMILQRLQSHTRQ